MQREELERIYGEVLSTTEATQKYEFIAFCAPVVEVKRKSDGKRGTLEFQANPRFYFAFVEDAQTQSR